MGSRWPPPARSSAAGRRCSTSTRSRRGLPGRPGVEGPQFGCLLRHHGRRHSHNRCHRKTECEATLVVVIANLSSCHVPFVAIRCPLSLPHSWLPSRQICPWIDRICFKWKPIAAAMRQGVMPREGFARPVVKTTLTILARRSRGQRIGLFHHVRAAAHRVPARIESTNRPGTKLRGSKRAARP